MGEGMNVLPCKNCGEKKGLCFVEYNIHWVQCLACKSSTARYQSKGIAIEKWNEGDIELPPAPAESPGAYRLSNVRVGDLVYATNWSWPYLCKDADGWLREIYSRIRIDVPENHEDILDFVVKDIQETADPIFYHSGDAEIAFRRFLER